MATKMRLDVERAVEEEWTPLSVEDRIKAARSARHVKLDEQAVKDRTVNIDTGKVLRYEVRRKARSDESSGRAADRAEAGG